jgi:undecaprenyl-diphosphatase
LRTRTLSLASVFLALFAALAVAVVAGATTQFDVPAFRYLNRLSSSSPVAAIATLVTQFGYEPVLVLFAVAVFLVDRRNVKLALEILIAFVLADAIVQVLDSVYFLARPYDALKNVLLPAGLGGGSSFPSGHATKAFAVAAVMVLAWGKKATPIALLACGVALSRVIIGVHYPTDVMAGALLGAAVGIFTVYLDEKLRISARVRASINKDAADDMLSNKVAT